MQLVLLILLIPVCSIGFFVYINALMNYAFYNVMNIPLFSGGLVVSLILSFILLHMFCNVRIFSADRLNFENKIMSYFGYFSFIILTLFGISLVINSINNDKNIIVLSIGVLIVLLFLYITFVYMLNYKKKVLLLTSIEDAIDLNNAKIDEDEDNEEKIEADIELPKEKSETEDNTNSNEIDVKCLCFEDENHDTIEFYMDRCSYEVDKHYQVIYNPKLKVIKKVIKEVQVIE